MFLPPWYVQYMLHIHVQRPSHAGIVLVRIRWFFFHTQRGQLTDIARNKKRLASRLAGSLCSQPVINTGHYQRFNQPHMTRYPPIGIAKLFEVFMNACF